LIDSQRAGALIFSGTLRECRQQFHHLGKSRQKDKKDIVNVSAHRCGCAGQHQAKGEITG
jgi:hypothetical protein